ncbi:MAG: hydantoinase B/oxoprolinase family protein [Acidobacteria bacterium]|nr:hydantoinase B/oxoprolinase family protein [Acidobacteriota bacterium]
MVDTLNPVKLEIFRGLFVSIAEEMGTVLKRTAYSPNIKERRDYSCAVFDGEGELVSMGDHMPVHLGSMPLSVRAALKEESFSPGDIVILNDPFSGGTHLPDLTLIAPVFERASRGKPIFYVACRAHHSDVGGMAPGSMPVSEDIFQEGLRIPPLKLYRLGKLNRELLGLLLANVRTPTERQGDLAGQVGALKVGEKSLLEIVERNGREEILLYLDALKSYAERMVRSFLESMPEGTYEAEDYLDDDGVGQQSIKIFVSLQIQGDHLKVDFTGSDSQARGSVNAVYAITYSAVYYVLRCLVDPDTPANEGLMRAVEVVAPLRSVVNAEYPSATAGGNVETSQRIVDVLLKALSQALPGRIAAASSGTMNNLCIGGRHPVTGQVFSYYETIGGGMGGGPQGRGDSGIHTHMTNSLNTPIEALEPYLPIRVREYRLRSNSGGGGRHRGGNGIVRCLEALSDCRVTILSERRKHAPYGLEGGRAGRKGLNFLVIRGKRRKLPGKISLSISPGDWIYIETPGGGGWGTGAFSELPPAAEEGIQEIGDG